MKFLIIITSFHSLLFAAANFNENVTAGQLAAQIQGTGITITNPVITRGKIGGGNSQVATFNHGIAGANLQIDSGILLTSSTAKEAFSTNDSGRTSKNPGTHNNVLNLPPYDTDLRSTLTYKYPIYNQVVFEFDVTLDDNTRLILINYQFASDEYPEWVGSEFNDAFGFFISGGDLTETYNIARVVDDTIIVSTENIGQYRPVNVNNVNDGTLGNQSTGNPTDLTNSHLFIDNGGTDVGYGGINLGAVVIQSEFDGFSTALHATLDNLTPGETYHFKMALADTSDPSYDAGVFIDKIVGLRTPRLCYDYSYKQNGIFFTEENNGSHAPRIVGSELSLHEPVTVELYIKSLESAEIVMEDLTVNIVDINTTQASYIYGSTYLILPDEVFPKLYDDSNYSDSHNANIAIGDIGEDEFFYVDYNLDPALSTLDMPMNITLNYTITLQNLKIPNISKIGKDIPLCSPDNFAYFPVYGTFNVENSALSQSQTQRYNLPTQTANRAGGFVIAAYEADNVNRRKALSTPVAIELIDADKYHAVDASCHESDGALTPRIWLSFGTTDGNQSVIDFDADTITRAIENGLISYNPPKGVSPLTDAESFYSQARQNTAFRISYNRAGVGNDIIQLEPSACKSGQTAPCYKVKNFPDLSGIDLGNGGGTCAQDIDSNPNSTDTISQYCGNLDKKALDSRALAQCMECIYGYNIGYVCSRDNFAIRPESFRMSLSDQDQTNSTQRSQIAKNNDSSIVHDTTTNESPDALQITAGYNYRLEINATNHQNDSSTPGYHATFPLDGNGSARSLSFRWVDSEDDAKCNDTSDNNLTTSFGNGFTELNASSPQIGKYNISIIDKLWTQVDWDPDHMTHHTGSFFLSQNGTSADCILGSSTVPIQKSPTFTYEEDMSGCDITTYNTDTKKYHTNKKTNDIYTVIALRIQPYTFDHSGIIPKIGPYTRTKGQTFVYINTPAAFDRDMSYNMNGTFVAAGFDGGRLSNFVTECYADDVNMTLDFEYLVPNPQTTPYLSYSLQDFNPTKVDKIYRPTDSLDFDTGTHDSNTTPFIITQEEKYFAKDMNGSITMDLGYNFIRTYNKALNPRYMKMNDFNITYKANPKDIRANLEENFKILGNKNLDTNVTLVTFVYGRAKSSQYLYDDVIEDSINTPVSIVIYCDKGSTDCDLMYNINTSGETDEHDWYLSIKHLTEDSDGKVTLNSSTGAKVSSDMTGASDTVNIVEESKGVDPNVRVTADAGTDRPLDVNISFGADASRWLIYNENANALPNAIPNPFYKVRFIGQGGWAGFGNTGHVVDNNEVTLTSVPSGGILPGELEKEIILRAFSCNIGGYKLEERDK